MITSIAKEANISGDRDEHIPAPMEGLAFDKALYHQSQGFPTQDPVLMYRDLKDYFYGRDNNGINAARAALTRYKINPTVSLKADITIFEETLKNVEYAANEIITENIRLSILDEKFCHDTRLGVRERLTHCQCSFFTYAATMDALKNTPNASVTPDNHSRMNNFQQVKSKDLCNKFLKGQCTYGEKCKYVHGDPAKGDTAKGGKPPTAFKTIADFPPTVPQAKPTKPKTHARLHYISEAHRIKLGAMTGKVTACMGFNSNSTRRNRGDRRSCSVALYSAYRTYVPYSLSPFRILNPDTVTVVMSSPASHRYRCFLV